MFIYLLKHLKQLHSLIQIFILQNILGLVGVYFLYANRLWYFGSIIGM